MKTAHDKIKSLMGEEPHTWFSLRDITERFNLGYSTARLACNRLVKDGHAIKRTVGHEASEFKHHDTTSQPHVLDGTHA